MYEVRLCEWALKRFCAVETSGQGGTVMQLFSVVGSVTGQRDNLWCVCGFTILPLCWHSVTFTLVISKQMPDPLRIRRILQEHLPVVVYFFPPVVFYLFFQEISHTTVVAVNEKLTN